MNNDLSDDDRRLLDMLSHVCWSCADVTPDMHHSQRYAAYRRCQDVLGSVLIDLLRSRLQEDA